MKKKKRIYVFIHRDNGAYLSASAINQIEAAHYISKRIKEPFGILRIATANEKKEFLNRIQND